MPNMCIVYIMCYIMFNVYVCMIYNVLIVSQFQSLSKYLFV